MKKIIISLILIIGIVQFYNENKGFGYVKSLNGETYFIYEEGLIDEIEKGDTIYFDSRDTRKGLEAINVKLKK